MDWLLFFSRSSLLLQHYVGQSMALHTRYPGHNGHQPQPGSPLGRVVDIINQVPHTWLPLRGDSTACQMICLLAELYICRGPEHIADKAACQPGLAAACLVSYP